MNKQYIPLTGIDCTIPCLLIDRNTPLDVLHANSSTRLLAVTQLMESLARVELKDADGVDLQHLANASAILLRDSCDLMDVMGWKVRA
ncbi:short-chain dehydrogenase [Pseudomonas sp. SK3(2021)]|uniref:short-chain dehydrogenase n=1 Tax=Pseudomonas sp. SK3(2021) TaxID=2841064 RepID=UPI00192CD9AC|nr:short-chain dehydrogenase [Pseudomonas sp. SK3(2021)]QQZ44636.1 short-chain dehydrogenase [Pseudomonas sp. SK3(2021)]